MIIANEALLKVVKEHPGSAVNDGKQAEDGVEDGDAHEIHRRPEVADTFLNRGIVNADRHLSLIHI